jgi:hypothetical protein
MGKGFVAERSEGLSWISYRSGKWTGGSSDKRLATQVTTSLKKKKRCENSHAVTFVS